MASIGLDLKRTDPLPLVARAADEREPRHHLEAMPENSGDCSDRTLIRAVSFSTVERYIW